MFQIGDTFRSMFTGCIVFSRPTFLNKRSRIEKITLCFFSTYIFRCASCFFFVKKNYEYFTGQPQNNHNTNTYLRIRYCFLISIEDEVLIFSALQEIQGWRNNGFFFLKFSTLKIYQHFKSSNSKLQLESPAPESGTNAGTLWTMTPCTSMYGSGSEV